MPFTPGGDTDASSINGVIARANSLHTHTGTDQYAGYGTDGSPTYSTTFTTGEFIPASAIIPAVVAGEVIDPILATMLANAVTALLSHVHSYIDTYGTACNCNCHCNCTRGTIS